MLNPISHISGDAHLQSLSKTPFENLGIAIRRPHPNQRKVANPSSGVACVAAAWLAARARSSNIVWSVVARHYILRARLSCISVAAYPGLRNAHTMQDHHKKYTTGLNVFVLLLLVGLRDTYVVAGDNDTARCHTGLRFEGLKSRLTYCSKDFSTQEGNA